MKIGIPLFTYWFISKFSAFNRYHGNQQCVCVRTQWWSAIAHTWRHWRMGDTTSASTYSSGPLSHATPSLPIRCAAWPLCFYFDIGLTSPLVPLYAHVSTFISGVHQNIMLRILCPVWAALTLSFLSVKNSGEGAILFTYYTVCRKMLRVDSWNLKVPPVTEEWLTDKQRVHMLWCVCWGKGQVLMWLNSTKRDL